MNGLNNTGDEVVECPLCLEPLEVDDLNFFPCTCGYQICRFCWHRIRTDENELCPACRKEYPENPADFTPLTQEEILAFKSQKRQRDQQRKQKITENRKHLSNVRVVQKNLVFVVGLPPRLADAEILKKHEYFGKYGKIHKVVINPSTTYAGVQGPSASAYVTYVHNNDALRAIQSVNNVMIDGRLIKTSLGTTKYCSHFMKNQQCPKSDCMYLHELGDPEASFTKEEMHQGKHQEYEKRLHDALIATSGTSSVGGIGHSNSTTGASALGSTGTNNKSSEKAVANGNASTSASNGTALTIASSTSTNSSAAATQQKEAWPSLSVSPINVKEPVSQGGKNKKEKTKPDKSKNDKNSRMKNKNVCHSSPNNNNSNTMNKENNSQGSASKEGSTVDRSTVFIASETANANICNGNSGKSKGDKLKEKSMSNRNRELYHSEERQVQKDKRTLNVDEEVKLIEGYEKQKNYKMSGSTSTNNNCSSIQMNKEQFQQNNVCKTEDRRSFSSNSNRSGSSNNSNVSINNSDLLSLSESASGKSSPGSFPDSNSGSEKLTNKCNNAVTDCSNSRGDSLNSKPLHTTENHNEGNNSNCDSLQTIYDNTSSNIKSMHGEDNLLGPNNMEIKLENSNESSDYHDTRATLSKMNLFEDNNSFFSSSASLQQSLHSKSKGLAELHQNQGVNSMSPHLPDLLKGIDGYQNNPVSNEFSNLGNHSQGSTDLNRLPQAVLLQQQQLGHTPEHLLSNNLFDANMSKFFDFHKNQQQQLHQQFLLNGYTSGSGNNTVSDHLRLVSMLENNRINSQFLDQPQGHLANQQPQQIQKQRVIGKFESMVNPTDNIITNYIFNSNVTQQLALQQQQQQQSQNQQHAQQKQQVLMTGPFSQNACVDDDLGFDPFIETQKGLAELMENEVLHHQNANVNRNDTTTIATKILQHQQQQNILENIQRTRMPPPGFNHMNAFGFGLPRTQNNSKMFPFMNMMGNSTASGAPQSQQPHVQASNSWNPHIAGFQSQQQNLNDAQMHQMSLNQSSGNHNKVYSNNDWTAMDPAILSFRQFSSFPQQTQMPHHPQPQDLFMQHLTQQQSGQNFAAQSQVLGGNNMAGNVLNSQAQANANVQGMLEYLKTRQFV